MVRIDEKAFLDAIKILKWNPTLTRESALDSVIETFKNMTETEA